MKRLLVSLFGFLVAFLLGYRQTSAADVPDALSSAGPALTTFNDTTILAWAGEPGEGVHKVWYSTFNGNSWSPETQVRGAETSSAPALAVAAGKIYLATTPPNADDKIYFYMSSGHAFTATGSPLCDDGMCAHTKATPALTGDGSALYAAWTTADGAIMYATRFGDVWKIEPVPVPNAMTSPTNGPTLALHGNALYLAWVTASGKTVEVESATLPLSSGSWSTKPKVVHAQTQVAPALGVLTSLENGPIKESLYLAWTTPAASIGFAYLNSASEWVASSPPLALPSGPLTALTPALNSFTFQSSNQECVRSDNLAYTLVGKGAHGKPAHQISVDSQRSQGCP